MTTFKDVFEQYDWDSIQQKIQNITEIEVKYSLAKTRRTVDDFLVLISPAAAPYLEKMAQMSRTLTQKRFGRTIQMYAPMYLSGYTN